VYVLAQYGQPRVIAGGVSSSTHDKCHLRTHAAEDAFVLEARFQGGHHPVCAPGEIGGQACQPYENMSTCVVYDNVHTVVYRYCFVYQFELTMLCRTRLCLVTVVYESTVHPFVYESTVVYESTIHPFVYESTVV
jgi:hypothetical protein